jgi:hypothetical protein
VQQIILDQSESWHFYLVRELIRSKLPDIIREFDDLERGLIYRETIIYTTPVQSITWLRKKFRDFENLLKFIDAIEEDFNNALNDQSNPAQAMEIKRVVDKIMTFCRELLNWDIGCHFTILPEQFNHIKENMFGWSHPCLLQINRIPEDIAGLLSKPKGVHQKIITQLKFEAPKGVDEILIEFDKLTQRFSSP